MNVYLLYHVRDPQDEETIKLCGVFSSEATLEAAKMQLILKPGFSRFPEAFEVGRYEVDQVYWEDGFLYGDDRFAE